MKKLSPLLLLLLTASCSSGLAVDTYPTQPDSAIRCKALFADGAQKVVGQKQVLVKDQNASAWGDPPIILRCGVESPAELGPASRCDMVAGVGWFTDTTADGYVFTTIGRQLFVSVEVPRSYDPAADALVDLADSVKKHDPVVKPCV